MEEQVMEEQKANVEVNGIEKPDYETLKYWLDKTISDNKQLVARLRQVTDTLNILPYLFKVVEMDSKFDTALVNRSKEAIKEIMFSSEKPEEEK